MFLILNNEIAFNKQILKVDVPPSLPHNGKGTSQFSDIGATGYTTGQIIHNKDITIVVNGVIKNLQKLAQKSFTEVALVASASAATSLEVLLVLYEQYGFEYMLQLLEGEFSIILLDHNLNKANSCLYVAQDRLGLCPLYMLTEDTVSDRKIIAFANTVKQLHLESTLYETHYTIQSFIPGTYSQYEYPFKVLSYWKPVITNTRYVASWPKNWLSVRSKSEMRKEFLKAVEVVKAALQDSIATDLEVCRGGGPSDPDNLPELNPPSHPLPIPRFVSNLTDLCQLEFHPPPNPKFGPIGCLLSGGIDSSILTGLIRNHLKLGDYNPDEILYTFSMGFAGSPDLNSAKSMADHMGSPENHKEFVLTEEAYMAAIPAVIEILETADIATVRYGVALYLLLSYIHDTTNIRDIFTGDGADETMGGFLNFFYMSNTIENDRECNRLLDAYHRTGALYRKLFAHFGMRWYRPFLNDIWLSHYMQLPMEFRYEIGSIMRYPGLGYEFDKDLLRVAFSGEHFKTAAFADLVPKSILWRTSEPGYDAVSSYYRPLWRIIEERLAAMKVEVVAGESYIPNPHGLAEPILELEYYRGIYRQYYPHMKAGELGEVPPYRFANTMYDPTMRNLDIYLEFHMEYQDRTV